MIAQVLCAKHPDRMAAFYRSLFEMEQSQVDGPSFTLLRPGMEIRIVEIPDSIAVMLSTSASEHAPQVHGGSSER
jgi:hypothetical protein